MDHDPTSALTSYIKHIEFRILSRRLIKEGSALKQSSLGVELNDQLNNEPASGGLLDARMGVSDKASICATCGLKHIECPGHFGHIDLESPLFHIYYISYIKEILDVICIKCSKLLINKSNEKKIFDIAKMTTNEGRMKKLIEATKNVKVCSEENGGCGSLKAKMKKVEGKNNRSLYLMATYAVDSSMASEKKKRTTRDIYPEECVNILKRISDKDCALMGFGSVRPENMIAETLLIPPVPVRPSVKVKGMNDSFDDLTKKLLSIIASTKRIGKKRKQDLEKGIPASSCNDSKLLSQYNYTTYLNNGSSNARSEIGGKPMTSLTSRLSGKDGRFRNNLLGKRVDSSGRTVVTPDPSISADQFRTPVKVAMTVTKPVRVTSQNIEYLREIVKNGKTKYPGANYLYKYINGEKVIIELHYGKDNTKLKVGDVVARHLQDGDIILVNRQPSLHKLSMLGHRVVVSKNPLINSFGLNPSVTTPYNADFDGDEMNIHVPQNIQPCLELEEIACVERQLITPRNSSPIIGIVQDGLIGAYMLSEDNTQIHWNEAMDIISCCTVNETHQSETIMKKGFISGKSLLSMIIPNNISIKTNDVTIINGKLVKGVLDKSMLKAEKKNNIIHTIWGEYDPRTAKTYIDNIQYMTDRYNAYEGFTVGIQDIEVDTKTQKQMSEFIETKKLQIKCMTTQYENNPNLYDALIVETNIQYELDKIRVELSKLLMNTLPKDGGIYVMVKSGAKGADINVCQMAGCVGLQSMDGGRIDPKVNGRTLCCYAKHDTSAEATGFVENSFYQGCDFAQYMIHLMSGRIGIVDKVIGTADTGYKQRKFIKFLEDIDVKYDLTVRDAKNVILQFAYGDNCLNPVQLYENNLFTLLWGNKEMKKLFLYSDKFIDHYNEMIALRDMIRESLLVFNYSSIKTKFNLAFDVLRLIKIELTNANKSGTRLTPEYVVKKLSEFTKYENTMTYCMTDQESKSLTSFKYLDELMVKNIMKYCVYQYLTPNESIGKLNMTKECFDKIYEKLIFRYNKNVISAGEAVGIVAAQSCGEILTQMKLNTFHSAGLGSVTSGIDRLNELINVTKKIKTPQMILYFNDTINSDIKIMNIVKNHIKYTTFENIINNVEIIYDPENKYSTIDDIDIPYNDNKKSKTSCQTDFDGLHWLIRLTLNPDALIDKDVSIKQIVKKICLKWRNRNSKKKDINGTKSPNKLILQCAVAISKSEKPIIHVKFIMKDSSINLAIKFYDYLSTIIIKGIGGITQVVKNKCSEEDIISFDSDGNIVKKTQYSIKTVGINMTDTKYLKNIDYSKVLCNDILTIYRQYGVEGVRNLLVKEFDSVYDGKVSYNHLSIIADLMTSKGKIMKIYRSGMSSLNVDTLAGASFEETVSTLIDGAVLEKIDNMSCVSSRIMAGLNILNGTGMVNTSLDVNMLTHSEHNENENFKYDTTNYNVSVDSIINDILNIK